jgi:hypothetical protein
MSLRLPALREELLSVALCVTQRSLFVSKASAGHPLATSQHPQFHSGAGLIEQFGRQRDAAFGQRPDQFAGARRLRWWCSVSMKKFLASHGGILAGMCDSVGHRARPSLGEIELTCCARTSAAITSSGKAGQRPDLVNKAVQPQAIAAVQVTRPRRVPTKVRPPFSGGRRQRGDLQRLIQCRAGPSVLRYIRPTNFK